MIKTQIEYTCNFCGVKSFDDHASDYTEIFDDFHTCLECQSGVEKTIKMIAKASRYQSSMRHTDEGLFLQIEKITDEYIKF